MKERQSYETQKFDKIFSDLGNLENQIDEKILQLENKILLVENNVSTNNDKIKTLIHKTKDNFPISDYENNKLINNTDKIENLTNYSKIIEQENNENQDNKIEKNTIHSNNENMNYNLNDIISLKNSPVKEHVSNYEFVSLKELSIVRTNFEMQISNIRSEVKNINKDISNKNKEIQTLVSSQLKEFNKKFSNVKTEKNNEDVLVKIPIFEKKLENAKKKKINDINETTNNKIMNGKMIEFEERIQDLEESKKILFKNMVDKKTKMMRI